MALPKNPAHLTKQPHETRTRLTIHLQKRYGEHFRSNNARTNQRAPAQDIKTHDANMLSCYHVNPNIVGV